jgi:hypothetical protein
VIREDFVWPREKQQTKSFYASQRTTWTGNKEKVKGRSGKEISTLKKRVGSASELENHLLGQKKKENTEKHNMFCLKWSRPKIEGKEERTW